MAKTLMKGNEALSEAAIRAGLKAFINVFAIRSYYPSKRGSRVYG